MVINYLTLEENLEIIYLKQNSCSANKDLVKKREVTHQKSNTLTSKNGK